MSHDFHDRTGRRRRAAATAQRGALRRPAELVCNVDVSGPVDAECGLQGELISIPNKEGYPESFDAGIWGLVEVPHIESFHGLIFGTWNPAPTSLREYLGDMAGYMDAMFDHDDEGTVVLEGVHNWELEGNWKLAAEQFATDWYHVNMSHASALQVFPPSDRKPKDQVVHRSGRQLLDPNGHGAGFPVHSKNRFNSQAGAHVDRLRRAVRTSRRRPRRGPADRRARHGVPELLVSAGDRQNPRLAPQGRGR